MLLLLSRLLVSVVPTRFVPVVRWLSGVEIETICGDEPSVVVCPELPDFLLRWVHDTYSHSFMKIMPSTDLNVSVSGVVLYLRGRNTHKMFQHTKECIQNTYIMRISPYHVSWWEFIAGVHPKRMRVIVTDDATTPSPPRPKEEMRTHLFTLIVFLVYTMFMAARVVSAGSWMERLLLLTVLEVSAQGTLMRRYEALDDTITLILIVSCLFDYSLRTMVTLKIFMLLTSDISECFSK